MDQFPKSDSLTTEGDIIKLEHLSLNNSDCYKGKVRQSTLKSDIKYNVNQMFAILYLSREFRQNMPYRLNVFCWINVVLSFLETASAQITSFVINITKSHNIKLFFCSLSYNCPVSCFIIFLHKTDTLHFFIFLAVAKLQTDFVKNLQL